MSVLYKFMNFIGLAGDDDRNPPSSYDDEDEWYEDDDYPKKKQFSQAPVNNVVSLQAVKQSMKVILMEPRSYEESHEIADHLRNRRPTIVNLHRVDQQQRVIDFLSGTVYALGGNIQKIGTLIYLCTPDNIDIQGNISEIMYDEYQTRMR